MLNFYTVTHEWAGVIPRPMHMKKNLCLRNYTNRVEITDLPGPWDQLTSSSIDGKQVPVLKGDVEQVVGLLI